MTILPKKKPNSSVGVSDHPDDPDRRTGSDPHQHQHQHSHGVRPGARPRASPPPWSYQAAPPASREDRRTESSSRPQQASPPPVGAGSSGGPGDATGMACVSGNRAELSGGVGCGGGMGGCCSGPGLSKRRRQATCSGGVAGGGTGPGAAGGGGGGGGGGGVGGPSPEQEEGAGYNSEDEYENASRLQSEDPATVEQQEHWFEKALQEKKGFVIKKMKEDGACLFRAVADQVYGDQDMHEVVRKHCMDYLMKNADYFSNYVTEDFTTYINRKRKNNCHGNHIEMQAMAEMYNRPVEVYQSGTEPINTFHGIHQNNDEPIRVSYHRNIHYNSVVNPNKATIGVGLGLPAFKPGFADQSLMKNAIKTSEESWIEQQMLEDKKRATDWEATNEAIEEQVARESYLQWLRDQEKQARQPRKASATCSSATAAASSGLEEWNARSPRQRSSAPSPEIPDPAHSDTAAKPPSPAGALALSKPPSPCAPGPSNQACVGPDRPTSSSLVSLYPALGYRAIMQEMSPTAFGLTDWEDDEILASVLAVSQQEYLDSMKKNAMHREPSPDSS
ncbi:OTU domain-containing protein 5-A [Danio rerio]|uniref:OTU domain-containing protein 5-A n=2 Tax=Danio rerio TaxID=7955 RepID=OTU5A_DANRE|nr:OTU domain-containing protein 5-A [Danio rerio]Q08BW0.1 RecName: Full=OTU domain-containing protein 5-A; AltName: Full=Deubiquitinating enzyme A; Short=DUBA [Danio rerio]AAI24534.1 OTU domain containing 5 [Danio rerio]|eukprot:NP_001068578.1 OTU domain-containing protein 5-A [Danio rerio]